MTGEAGLSDWAAPLRLPRMERETMKTERLTGHAPDGRYGEWRVCPGWRGYEIELSDGGIGIWAVQPEGPFANRDLAEAHLAGMLEEGRTS